MNSHESKKSVIVSGQRLKEIGYHRNTLSTVSALKGTNLNIVIIQMNVYYNSLSKHNTAILI